jgi:hypothetical protein
VALAIALCVAATLFLGVTPGGVVDYTLLSARQMMTDTAAPAVAARSAAADEP